jgi:cyclin-dependent kinase 10
MASSSAASLAPGACGLVHNFAKGDKLGEGTYGSVYRATDKRTGAAVALKRLKLSGAGFEREGMPLTALREISLLRRVCHPNIITLLEVAVGHRADAVFLVFEYCPHELSRLVDTMARPFGQGEVRWMAAELLRAVAYLHANLIVHRDLKMSNLLLSADGTLKLCDFGLARTVSLSANEGGEARGEAYTPKVVTLWYRAPELLLGTSSYGPAVDMWSIGCIVGELLLHRPLIPASTELGQLTAICNLLGTPSARIWPGVTALPLWGKLDLPEQPYNDLAVRFSKVRPGEAALDFLNALLTFDPHQRASAASAATHAYLTGSTPRAERPHSHMKPGAQLSGRRGGIKRPRLSAGAAEPDAMAPATGTALAPAPAPRPPATLPVPEATLEERTRIPSPCDVAAWGARLC